MKLLLRYEDDVLTTHRTPSTIDPVLRDKQPQNAVFSTILWLPEVLPRYKKENTLQHYQKHINKLENLIGNVTIRFIHKLCIFNCPNYTCASSTKWDM